MVTFENTHGFRYTEKTIYQAIIQKLARMVSTLHATKLLMETGFIQEQASLQRILDEIQEDIWFLTLGALKGKTLSPLHQEYLDIFYAEELETKELLETVKRKPMIRRRKIQAYIANTQDLPTDPHSTTTALRTLGKLFSGFVHASSAQTMDMFGGSPARFHMSGLANTPIHHAYHESLRNYFIRGVYACTFATKAFGHARLHERLSRLAAQLDPYTPRDQSRT